MPSPAHRPEQTSELLQQKASLVANLAGWSGSILCQPWYRWLTCEDVLVTGGTSITKDCDDAEKRNMGQAGYLYRLPVRAGMNEKQLLVWQKPLAMLKLSRGLQEYGGSPFGGAVISPDRRWLLLDGVREGALYRAVFSLDGRRELVCLLDNSYRASIDYDIPHGYFDSSSWLPDSTGILETKIVKGSGKRPFALVTGRVRLLSSWEAPRTLAPVRLEKVIRDQWWDFGTHPVRMLDVGDGTTIAVCVQSHPEPNDPNWNNSGLQRLPPDQAILYQWNWQARTSSSVRAEVIIMPPGTSVFDQAISRKGDSIVWALMDRPHHAVVAGAQIKARGEGEISLWVSKMLGGRAATMRKLGHITVPSGQEAWYYQRFGLGEWLPGDRRISFQIGNLLYTIPLNV